MEGKVWMVFLLRHQQWADQGGEKKNAMAVLSEMAKQREKETTARVWIIPRQGSGNVPPVLEEAV